MGIGDLIYSLIRFIHEVRKVDGSNYPSETLYSMIMMIQGFLATRGTEYQFLEDNQFKAVKNSLDNHMKGLAKQGYVQPCNQAVPISHKEEDMLWEKGILGDHNPEVLVNMLMYLLGIHFALRGGDEHKALKVGFFAQIKVMYDQELDVKYLQYQPMQLKNNQGGIKDMRHKPKVVKAYENLADPKRCVVHIFEKYMGLCPSIAQHGKIDFYPRPLSHVPDNPKQPWFSCQPMGINAIQSVLAGICARAGLTGKCINHALKVIAAMRMYEKGVDEQLIQERLSNSSEAVHSYKLTSSEQNVKISEILYGSNVKKPKIESAKVEMQSKAPSEIVPSSTSSQSAVGSNAMMVNYSYHRIEPNSAPIVNVYPIINVPGGTPPNQPIVVNVNIVLNKWKHWWKRIKCIGVKNAPRY